MIAARFANPRRTVFGAISRAIAPRKPLMVSEWADLNRYLSTKGSAEAGRWRTDRNPPLREPMDCMSARHPARKIVCMWPIQFGKTEIEVNALGYIMDHSPGPTMVCLPGEVTMTKWVNQKLTPMIDETPVVKNALTSVSSRDSSNTRTFKDFQGGQLYMEHAGSPSRLKSTTVKYLIVDELDEFVASLTGGDDPVDMLDGRTSAFPGSSKSMYVSSPQMKGASRTEALWEESDQRRYHVPCPHCGEFQHLEWSGLKWVAEGKRVKQVWYVCRECGCMIEEHEKTAMIAAGRWVPENPDSPVRGYHINCLYYQLGLGPRWHALAEMWLKAQDDPAKLKTFVNDRLAETWEDPSMRKVKHNIVADRAESYPLATAPDGVLAVTAGVDTQDNRLAVQLVGWGAGMVCWVIQYIELMGDPAEPEVWIKLTDLLNRGVAHVNGAQLPVLAMAVDAGGHRTHAVYDFVRSRRVRRPLAIFGAKQANAPVLSRGKFQEVNWKGRVDKAGVISHHVGTIAIKHLLFSWLAADADRSPETRRMHFSDELDETYFAGLISETYNPAMNRFEKRRGVRNEPLDTWVYAYAAAHHPELRLHAKRGKDWEAMRERLNSQATRTVEEAPQAEKPEVPQQGAETAEVPAIAPKKKRKLQPMTGWSANEW
jgi:phage terminase large subunit GpA-like protein